MLKILKAFLIGNSIIHLCREMQVTTRCILNFGNITKCSLSLSINHMFVTLRSSVAWVIVGLGLG